jgi:hypothetical protein
MEAFMKMVHWSLAALLTCAGACSSDHDGHESDRGNANGDGDGAGDGDGDGAGDGDDDGDKDGSGGSDEFCEETGVRADHTTPDMLIVLDRSGSMGDEGRWEPSRAAVESVTEQLDDAIRFGLMLFPLDDGSGGFGFPDDTLACADGKLEVPIALNNAGAIADRLGQTFPFGGTPTGGTLDTAVDTLEALRNQPDKVAAPQFVLLVSDGQPTCPAGDGYETTQPDIKLATDAIDKLLEQGVKTYVIGYDTQSDAALAAVLDEFAQHGGTMQHRPVEDEDTLIREFQEIAGEVVSCSFTLEKEPEDPQYVYVTLDDEQLHLNEGWTISGSTVTLTGPACEKLQDGKEHRLLVQVKCDLVDPLL